MRSTDPIYRSASLASFIWGNRSTLRSFVVWRIASILLIAPLPILVQSMVDRAVPNRDYQLIALYTIGGLALLVLHYVSMRYAVKLMSTQIQEVVNKLRANVFSKLQFMHFGFLDKTQAGRLLSKYVFDTHNIESAMIVMLSPMLAESVRALVIIIVLSAMNAWNIAFLAICLPIYIFIRIYFLKAVETNNNRVRLARERLTGRASEYISAIKLVRGFGQEPEVNRSMDETSDAYSESRRQQMLVNQTLSFTVFVVSSAITLLVVSFGSVTVIKEQMSLGMLVALTGSIPAVIAPINLITQFSLQYYLGRESYRSIKELIDSRYVEKWSGQTEFETLKGEISFETVSFQYDPGSSHALSDIDLRIPAGSHIAFVGASGSGKSTLVNLTLGLYAPTNGVIKIDGIAQENLSMRSFRQQCSIVMQDSLLLSGTILENIRFVMPGASEAQVIEAAKTANAWEFIRKLPHGILTKVGERGNSLSGGQRQRIAIARAILRNPRILILDEATSALDNESEKLVQEALDLVAQGRTTITIAHRLSAVRRADKIVVLKHGRIVETGTFEKLASYQDGTFRRLLDSQR